MNTKRSRRAHVIWFAVITAMLFACADEKRVKGADSQSGNVASTWFDFLYRAVKAGGVPPPPASRVYSHVAIALYESVAPGAPRLQSLVGQVQGLGTIAAPADEVDWSTVANAAMAAVTRGLLVTASAEVKGELDALEQSFHGQRTAIVGVTIAERSSAHGREVARVVLARAASDGASNAACPYTPVPGPGYWAPTPPAFATNPLLPCWGRVTPMVLPTASTCARAPLSAFSTNPGSVFYGQMYEVYSTVNSLTAEQLDIANFWADNPGATGTPAGHWMRSLAQYVDENDLKLDVAAEAFARVGIAVNDAFISCWDTKYTYNTIRPISYVRLYIDASWPLPPVGTPPFPDYPSGHSVQSGAAAQVLTGMFGDVAYVDRVHVDDLGLPPRSFESWNAAADEAAISRLYGGIHYRDSIDIGVEHGRCIGREIETRVHFER